MRPLRVLLALALALPLTGCAAIFGMCGPTDQATWRQPGLFEALGKKGAIAQEPPPGLPVDEPAFLARFPDAQVQSVTWRGGVYTFVALEAGAPPRLQVSVPAGTHSSEAVALARAFLPNWTAGALPSSWEDDLLASQRQGVTMISGEGEETPLSDLYALDVRVPLRWATHLRESGTLERLAPGGLHSAGESYVRDDATTVHLRYAVREHGVKTDEGELRLRVDASDAASMSLARAEGSDQHRTLAVLNQTLLDLGVAPQLPAQVGTLVC